MPTTVVKATGMWTDMDSEPGVLLFSFQGLAKKYQHGASNVKLPKDKARQGKDLVGLLTRGS